MYYITMVLWEPINVWSDYIIQKDCSKCWCAHETKKQCIKCNQQNRHLWCYADFYFEVSSVPRQFIAMDLIGSFKWSSQGYQYVLTVIFMLMNDAWCMLLYIREAKKWCPPTWFMCNLRFIGCKRFCQTAVLHSKVSCLHRLLLLWPWNT